MTDPKRPDEKQQNPDSSHGSTRYLAKTWTTISSVPINLHTEASSSFTEQPIRLMSKAIQRMTDKTDYTKTMALTGPVKSSSAPADEAAGQRWQKVGVIPIPEG